jgi:hypothetical protein
LVAVPVAVDEGRGNRVDPDRVPEVLADPDRRALSSLTACSLMPAGLPRPWAV